MPNMTPPLNIGVSAGGSSNLLRSVTLSNSNGVSFGLDGSTVTASHNGLTTAMASNRGTDFVQATAVFNGTNASGTIASNAISISVNAGGGGGSLNLSAGTTSNNLTNAVFSNSNGISFGLNGSTVTASHNALTTAMASNRGSDFVQATAGFNGTNASGTIASNSISVSVNAQSNQSLGLYGSGNTSGTSSGTADARSMTVNVSGSLSVNMTDGKINLSAPNALTTAMQSNKSTDFVQATAGFNGTNASGTIASNSISVSVANPGITESGTWEAFGLGGDSTTVLATNNVYLASFAPRVNHTGSIMQLAFSFELSSTTGSSISYLRTQNIGLYSRSSDGASVLTLISSTSLSWGGSSSSNNSVYVEGHLGGFDNSTSWISSTSSSAGIGMSSNFRGLRVIEMPFNTTLKANETYWLAYNAIQSTSGTSNSRFLGASFVAGAGFVQASHIFSASNLLHKHFLGSYLFTSSNMPDSIGSNQLVTSHSSRGLEPQFMLLDGTL